MRTIDKILTKAYSQYGAQMGRSNVGTFPPTITSGPNCRIFKKNQTKVFECRIKLDTGGYDKGGAYWGLGSELRVQYTKDLTYIKFFRK